TASGRRSARRARPAPGPFEPSRAARAPVRRRSRSPGSRRRQGRSHGRAAPGRSRARSRTRARPRRRSRDTRGSSPPSASRSTARGAPARRSRRRRPERSGAPPRPRTPVRPASPARRRTSSGPPLLRDAGGLGLGVTLGDGNIFRRRLLSFWALVLLPGDPASLLDRVFDGADHVEGLLRQVVVLPADDLLEALDRVLDLHVLARGARELL